MTDRKYLNLDAVKQVMASGNSPAEVHACMELCRYFKKITGRSLIVRKEPLQGCPSHSLLLTSAKTDGRDSVRHLCPIQTDFKGPDDFLLEYAGQDGLWLCGASSRALHYAVYELLNRIGCHWPSVGVEWEILPAKAVRRIPDPGTRQTPRFHIRGLDPVDMIAGYTPQAIVAHLDWMVRNRMNLFYFMLRTEREYVIESLLPLAAREAALRGIDVAIPVNACDVIPYSMLYKYPEIFAFAKTKPLYSLFKPVEVKGGYRIASQLCVASPELPGIYTERLRALLKRLPPEVGILCPIGNDGQGFCCCPKCRVLKPADHVQKIWNMAATTVRRHRPGMRMARYAYTSWQEPPTVVPIDTDTCEHVLYDVFTRNDEIPMDSRLAGPASSRRFKNKHFELMGVMRDWVDLQLSVAPWHNSMKMYRRGTAAGLARVFTHDFDLYERAGAAGAIFEAYIQYWHGFAPNFYTAARALWQSGLSADKCLAEFCDISFGSAAAPMRLYLQWLERLTWAGGKIRRQMVMDRITDADIMRVQGYFKQARRSAGIDRKILRRIGDMEDHFNYMGAWRNENRLVESASRKLRAGNWAAASDIWRAAIRANEQTARAAERIERRFDMLGWKWAQSHRVRVNNYFDRLKEVRRAEVWHRPLADGRHILNPALFDTPHLGAFGSIMARGVRLASAAGGQGRDELGFCLHLARPGACRLRITGGNVIPVMAHKAGKKPVIEIKLNGHRVFKGYSGLPDIPVNALTGESERENGVWCLEIPARYMRRRNTVVMRLTDLIAGYSTHMEMIQVEIDNDCLLQANKELR